MVNFYSWLEKVTQRDYEYANQVQAALWGGVAFLSSSIWGMTPPLNAAAVAISTYAISKFSAPYFVENLQPYEEYSLVPTSGQVAQISFSVVAANLVCKVLGKSVRFKVLPLELGSFLLIIGTTRFILQKSQARFIKA